VTASVEASGLGKRYGKTWALRDCTLSAPARARLGDLGIALSRPAGKLFCLILAVAAIAVAYRLVLRHLA
jgi:ABC-2 type transport system ATP-binding protein